VADPRSDDADLDARVLRRILLTSAVFLTAVAFVNTMTLLTEAERAGAPFDARVPWILEFSSVLVLFALVPLVALFERRVPITAETWRTALIWHALASIVFSGLHVLGMYLLRKLSFALWLAEDYRFFGDPISDALYEYRKDILPYAIIVLVLSLLRGIEERRREAAAARLEARDSGRLTLKLGGRTIFLDAGSMDWASAAGNYVEVRANGTTHLARISLGALEQQLAETGIDVVRVHRSHIVNRAKVREIAPARDGDFRIRMADGSELRGSRRYRHLLPA
jgi:hypothetical protein